MKRIMIASPLFNEKERQLNKEIETEIKSNGLETYLPQRDGFLLQELVLELINLGIQKDEAARVANRTIFLIDAYNAYKLCDGAVVNLNGRVPDEGALVEGTLAFCAQKPLVFYKNDSRTLIAGQDNPMILGLAPVVSDIKQIVPTLLDLEKQEPYFARMLLEGRKIAKAYAGKNLAQVANFLTQQKIK